MKQEPNVGLPDPVIGQSVCQVDLCKFRRTAERRPVPFIYGSEAQYRQGDAIIECPTYQHKESLFKYEAI